MLLRFQRFTFGLRLFSKDFSAPKVQVLWQGKPRFHVQKYYGNSICVYSLACFILAWIQWGGSTDRRDFTPQSVTFLPLPSPRYLKCPWECWSWGTRDPLLRNSNLAGILSFSSLGGILNFNILGGILSFNKIMELRKVHLNFLALWQ